MVGPTRCEDGWRSASIGKQGACSYHGGVNDTPRTIVGVFSAVSGLLGGLFIYSLLERKQHKEEESYPKCNVHNIPMRKKHGRYGDFWGCSKYPACRVTKNMEKLPVPDDKMQQSN